MTEVCIGDRRALNQALIFTKRVPACALREPGVYVRALRSALRMSQQQLARRSGVPKANIVRLETGRTDPRFSTLKRLLDAMFCDAVFMPLARKRPSEAIALRRLEPWDHRRWRLWDEPP